MDFKTKYNHWLVLVNTELDRLVPEKDAPEKTIYIAMRYSLMAGGKRLRPILALAACELCGGDINDILPYACAIEMIHTYSLIHDDLPAMDNDDFRRGRPTSHKVFGEAVAVLAGDALLNSAFEIMLSHASTLKTPDEISASLKAMKLIASAAGISGMIGGQVVDLESENSIISEKMLLYMHKCKTGELIKAPVLAAASICGADVLLMNALLQYSEKIGLVFQIKDDILDIEGNSGTMGKNTGSDISNNKSTFVTQYGLDQSKKMMNELTAEAIKCIEVYGERARFLIELAYYIINREG